jgi:hypothetical protein
MPDPTTDFSYVGSIHACEYAKSRLTATAEEGEAKGLSHSYDRYVIQLLDVLVDHLKTEFDERFGFGIEQIVPVKVEVGA